MSAWLWLAIVVWLTAIVTAVVVARRPTSTARSPLNVLVTGTGLAILLTQLGLNVFGSLDILSFTGVTFPFVSAGGTSMMASWAILAFFKAADMRKDASIAIKRSKVKVSLQDYAEETDEDAEEV